MIIYKPYAPHAAWCSILPHQMREFNYCSNRYNTSLIRLFDNPDEPIKTISPTMKIIELLVQAGQYKSLGSDEAIEQIGKDANLLAVALTGAGWERTQPQ